MFNMSKTGIITATRGDSYTFKLFLNSGKRPIPIPYDIKENTDIYFALTEPNQPFEKAILKKKYTNQDVDCHCLEVKFVPNDTICLMPGKYYYQVKLKQPNGTNGQYDVITIIDRHLFYIVE